MFKKNCLALLSLGLFSSFANASAYSDKLAEMQAKFEQALKGDQAAAAYVCRQGNLPLSSAMTFFQGKRNETFPEGFTIVS